MGEKEKHVAVVSSDLIDFLKWKEEMNLKGEMIDTRKKFKVGNTTYHCIYKPTHLIGLLLNNVVETYNAKKGGAYNSIMTLAKKQLISDPQQKINFTD